jgi:hypothetical protein
MLRIVSSLLQAGPIEQTIFVFLIFIIFYSQKCGLTIPKNLKICNLKDFLNFSLLDGTAFALPFIHSLKSADRPFVYGLSGVPAFAFIALQRLRRPSNPA